MSEEIRRLTAGYADEYRLVDNEWRFSRRTLTTLYHGPPDLSGAFIDPTV